MLYATCYMKTMIILGIESSCDDTSASLLKVEGEHFEVLVTKTASQIEVHKQYGGVVPEVAGRQHAMNILPTLQAVLKDQPKPDLIAATSGPGLVTGLLVGTEAARSLSYLWNIPLVGVNHIDGHIHSVELSKNQTGDNTIIQFPALALIVSGGHTELILMKERGQYECLGKTRDDAVGECFDKVAKLLDLDYPGGPKISRLAETGRTDAIPFPRPMIKENTYDFSFAGLKTAALYWLRDNSLSLLEPPIINLPVGFFGIAQPEPTINDFCASFEQAIVDVLTHKTLRAVEEHAPKTVILSGGVSANKKLRETLQTEIRKVNKTLQFLRPELEYCMDNASMIALAGYYQHQKGVSNNWQELRVDPNWRVALLTKE